MIFKYGLKQLKRRPFASILLLFMFAAIILLIDFVVIRLNGYFVNSNLMKNVCTDKCYYVGSAGDDGGNIQEDLYEEYKNERHKYYEKYNNGEITKEEFDKINLELLEEWDRKEKGLLGDDEDITKLPYIKETFSLCSDFLGTDPDEHDIYNVYAMNKEFSSRINFKLKKGKWFTEAFDSDGYVNLVAMDTAGYKMGDIVDLYDYDYTKYNKTSNESDIVPKKIVQGKIIGLISYSYYQEAINEYDITLERGYLSSNDLLSSISEDRIFMQFSDEVYNKMLNKENNSPNECIKSVMLKDDLTQEEREEFIKSAADMHFGVYNMYDCYKNTYMKEMKEFKNDIIYISLSFLISIIALIGISAINVARERRTYCIYCLNGMTRNQCIKINAVCLFMLIISSTVIALSVKIFIAFNEFKDILEWYNEIISTYPEAKNDTVKPLFSDYFSISSIEYFVIISLIIVSVVIAMIIPYMTINKLDINQNIKEDG